jgi:hypothetical protein
MTGSSRSRCARAGRWARDNQEVLGDWLGLSADDIHSLQAEEVI